VGLIRYSIFIKNTLTLLALIQLSGAVASAVVVMHSC